MRIRRFFLGRDYLEVFTPTLSTSLIPEPTIRNFETEFINEFMPRRKMYLIPSPEIFMKRMIAEGSPSIFQISQCFRNAEQLGTIHNPEFSMLEYYSLDFDEEDSIALTHEFLKETALEEADGKIRKKPLVMSVKEAVWQYSHFDLDEAQSVEKIRIEAEKRGHVIPSDEAWDDTFNRIFITDVEPSLPKDSPVILKDYPVQIDCLAEKKNDFYRARWEMYIDGIEIANSNTFYPEAFAWCLEKKLAVVPGSAFYTDSAVEQPFLRLNFSTPTKEQIDRGVAVMAQVLAEMTK